MPGVVGSLWPVDDLAASLVMIRFHELHSAGAEGGGTPPAKALQQAQLWLRTVTTTDLLEYLVWRRTSPELREIFQSRLRTARCALSSTRPQHGASQ